ncbi:proteasome accessory factor PafA2 family protein [Rhodopirellula halodulae]|uniref:proteasome accessory factor PafA2 family protein n=1 Tax=Rhodopirellula halodulae TaxID=2894198 RepID=UPI001E2A9540|nr:proteasome accessory factor PafA2 family protein [Rhodopirellula sp. JC737]MCC9655490.1 proteasome accessory factor PafA2 family protein [Rhodopirellula sp. JC737]
MSSPAARLAIRQRLCRRLMGMETEFATFVEPLDGGVQSQVSAREVYVALRDAICRQMPAVEGLDGGDRRFFANGSALNLETHLSFRDEPGGLVEMATPEVLRPSDLVACQRAIDEIMREASGEVHFERGQSVHRLRVLKNSCDAAGHLYGCQENYETDVASGLGLVAYRLAIVCLWAMQVICVLLSIPVVASIVVASMLQRGLSNLRLRRGINEQTNPAVESDEDQRVDSFTDDDEWLDECESDSEESFVALPRWFQWLSITLMRILHLPLVFGLRVVGSHFAFRAQRRYLTGLLVSRIAIMGTGHLDHDGCFFLSGKAFGVDRVTDIGGFSGERPIFVYGHWLTKLCGRSWRSIAETRHLLKQRQRLQIGLSDSNLSDLAQWAKIGSVALVLDMIESKETRDLPRLRRPIRALHVFNRDWNLLRRVPTTHGEMTSLELQTKYYRAAEAFVRKQQSTTKRASEWDEAERALQHWAESIRLVRQFRKDGHQTSQGLGRIDWLGKRWMIDQAVGETPGESASWTIRKKIDLRYHELSEEGYFARFMEDHQERELIHRGDVTLRRRNAPADSPAAHRGWMIREFSGEASAEGRPVMRTDWDRALVNQDQAVRTVVFREADKRGPANA